MNDEHLAVIHHNSTIVSDEDISSNDGMVLQLQLQLQLQSQSLDMENENENDKEVEKVVDCSCCSSVLPGQEGLSDKMNTLPYPTPCFLSHPSNPFMSIPIPTSIPKPMPALMKESVDEMLLGNCSCSRSSDIFDYTTSLQQ